MYSSHSSSAESKIYEKITPSSAIQNSLLAITTAAVNDRQEVIRDSSVKGYIYVAEVDELKKKIKVLSPQPGGVPGNAMVLGGWPEGVDDLV
jgi:polyribonucleotide 5'-hydroxyl-kinase